MTDLQYVVYLETARCIVLYGKATKKRMIFCICGLSRVS